MGIVAKTAGLLKSDNGVMLQVAVGLAIMLAVLWFDGPTGAGIRILMVLFTAMMLVRLIGVLLRREGGGKPTAGEIIRHRPLVGLLTATQYVLWLIWVGLVVRYGSALDTPVRVWGGGLPVIFAICTLAISYVRDMYDRRDARLEKAAS